MPLREPELIASLQPDEITPANWLGRFCELEVRVEHISNEDYRRGWSDALCMVRALARHAQEQLRGNDE